MKHLKLSRFLIALSFTTLMLSLSLKSLPAAAQDADLKAISEKWWIDYAAALKKVLVEKDDSRAAALMVKMKTDIIPPFQTVIMKTQAFKKTHSKAEYDALKEWSEKNVHSQEVSALSTSSVLLMKNRNPEFAKAYSSFNHDLAMAGKKGMDAAK